MGLCWLKKSHSKFLAGSDSGQVRLMDVDRMSEKGPTHNYTPFGQLTSVSCNCLDEKFIVSGYSRHIALYDLHSGQQLDLFQNLHNRDHINVVKFANLNPNLFVTSSFDCHVKVWDLRQKIEAAHPLYTHRSKNGTVMACFSDDDRYILGSAVDNEVTQYFSLSGELHFRYPVRQKRSGYNYTRSYYMMGPGSSLYTIIGSCDENSVHIFNAETGAFVRDIELTLPVASINPQGSVYCQSLRGDPFFPLNFSVLVNSNNILFGNRIVHVDLMRTAVEEGRGVDDESDDDVGGG